MRRALTILALSLLGGILTDHVVYAGNHNHSGNRNHSNNGNHSNKPLFQVGPKVLSGNKNGMGFIADPVRRPLKNTSAGNTNPKLGNFIADPLHLPTGNPTRVAPVVRDHTLPNPNAIPPKPRNTAIQGGGLGLGLNPFDFQAPVNFDNQVRDHRTTTTGFPGVQNDPKKGRNGWTSNTSWPANRSPVER